LSQTPDILGESSSPATQLPEGVNVVGYFGSEKGVGEQARSLLRVLDAAHIPHVANNVVDSGSVNVEPLPAVISQDSPYPVNLVVINAEQFAEFAIGRPELFRSRYNIGYWAWELPTFPEEWSAGFDHLDEVWTISTFARDSIAKRSPVPVKVLPNCLDFDLSEFPALWREDFGMRDDCFVFLFAFDFHSTVQRKNPSGLITAFKNAFGSRRDVELIIKSSHSGEHLGELEELHREAQNSNIRFLDETVDREVKNSLFMAADAYVSLHRSEGFGMTLAESMLCAVPTIATDYSGNCDFLSAKNGFPVAYKLTAIEADYGPYRAGSQWAEPDLDNAVDVMRFVEQHRVAAAEIGLRARADVSHRLHPVTIGKTACDLLAKVKL
jgi:glycosyltransferase involved in cell wall biosynthesis